MSEREARQGFPAPLSSLGEGLGVRADLLTLAAEADRRLTQIEQLFAQASQEVSRLGRPWGQFVENLVEPAVVQLFHARGIEVLRALAGVRKSTAQLFDMEQPQNGIPRRDKRDTKGARPWVADRAGLT